MPRERVRYARTILTGLTVLVLGVATLACLAWVVGTLTVRPLDGVEGEVLYEASRLRAGLTLYVDPIVGTADVPPSRFYVLYPPVWSALLTPFSRALSASASAGAGAVVGTFPVAAVIGRGLAYAAFVASIVLAASRARPFRSARVTSLASLFAISFFPIVLFGASARPDSLALLVATIAFTRTLRDEKLDAAAGALFAVALLVKPNMMGLALGAFAAAASLRPRGIVRPLASGIAVGLFAALVLWFASSGAFLTHLLRSTGQSLSVSLWLEQLAHRLPFVAIPLALAVAWAWPVRSDTRVRIALFSLAASVLWTLFCLAKIGSASNYWMEPSVAALAVVATAEARRRHVATLAPWRWSVGCICAGLLLAQSVWNGVAAVKSSREGMTTAFARRDALFETTRRCRSAATDVIVADEPGIELQTNGRILGTPFQMAHLFASGKLSREPWLRDLERPEVRCVIAQRAELEGEPWPTEHRRFDLEIRSAIRQRFVLDDASSREGLFVYRRRDAH